MILPEKHIRALVCDGVRHTVVAGVKHTGECSPISGSTQRLLPSGKKHLFLPFRYLRCRHQIHQDLPGLHRLAHQKMTQISGVAQFVIIRQIPLFKIRQRHCEHRMKIIVYNPAFRDIHDIVEAAALVHAKCQRSVLVRIAERKLHLIPVLLLSRARLDSKEFVVCIFRYDDIVDQFFYL